MQIHKTFSVIVLTFCLQLSYANEIASSDNSKPAIRENAKFVFTNVKSYKRSEYNLKDAKTGALTAVVNRDFVGTVKVDRVIDFMKIEVNLFDKDGVYIDKCAHQEYDVMTPAKEKYFLVRCYNMPAEVESHYRSHRIDAFSYNPISPATQPVTSPATQAPVGISVSEVKEEPKPKFILTNLKSYPSQGFEGGCSSLYREFVGTVQVDRLVDFISLNADLYDKKGVFLYRCDTQIHDGIAPKVKIPFLISCPNLPPEVEKRYHRFMINVF